MTFRPLPAGLFLARIVEGRIVPYQEARAATTPRPARDLSGEQARTSRRGPLPYAAEAKNGALLVELAAREAGRRKHQNWKRVPATDLIAVLEELGFRIEVA